MIDIPHLLSGTIRCHKSAGLYKSGNTYDIYASRLKEEDRIAVYLQRSTGPTNYMLFDNTDHLLEHFEIEPQAIRELNCRGKEVVR